MNAENLAANVWDDPERSAECQKYYEVLVDTLNSTAGADGTQDALCLFEALSILIGQLLANNDDTQARGFLEFISQRAMSHRPGFREAGTGARHFVEDLN